MKKFILSLAVAMCAVVSASAQDWSLGARIGSGFQAVAEYAPVADRYYEGRFGMSWCNGAGVLNADFTALHNWNIATMDWTPSAGEWFFDAGVGLAVGGAAHYAYVGVAGCAKLGIKFNNAPLKLSIDYTPVVGPGIGYGGGAAHANFNTYGFANLGATLVYNF